MARVCAGTPHYLPALDRRRLADCCAAARIRVAGAHSALGDARAAAALLADFSLTDALDEGAPAGSLAYLEKLAEAVEDGVLAEDEIADLDDVSAELRSVAAVLGLPDGLVVHTLDQAEAARHARLGAGLRPLPVHWKHGEPLRVGDKVVFTPALPRRDRGPRSRPFPRRHAGPPLPPVLPALDPETRGSRSRPTLPPSVGGRGPTAARSATVADCRQR